MLLARLPRGQSSSSSSSISDSNKSIFMGLNIHIVQAKLSSSEIEEFLNLAQTHGANVRTKIEAADVIVTGISMRKRFERHLDWEIAKEKTIVTPSWLRDSAKSGQLLGFVNYLAIKELLPSSTPVLSSEPSNPRLSNPAIDPLAPMSRFATHRLSPLICPNQDIALELAIIWKARELEGDAISALSYQRAIAAIKAYPKPIKSSEQLVQDKVPFVGPKTLLKAQINEFITTSHISEAQTILGTTRFQTLSEFTKIYGIGAQTARELYDKGMRTLEHLEGYYDTLDGYSHIKEALTLRVDLSIKIPRDEVEEIAGIVARELAEIQGGCIYTICGGYRRGKQESNDVDIIFTHPQRGKEKGLCTKLVKRLVGLGLITHVMPLSTFSSTETGQFNDKHVEKAITVFQLPITHGVRRIRRRLDLLFSPHDVYWPTVVGWTGSTMFERDLRLWAKGRGLKFASSGITRRRDAKLLSAFSEKEVFDILGTPYIDPTMRNADV